MKRSGASTKAGAEPKPKAESKPKAEKKQKSKVSEDVLSFSHVNEKQTFYVVAVEPPRHFHGIIGPLDLYKIHVLVEGTGQPLQEVCPLSSDDAASWYRSHLESQGLTFTKTQSITPIVHILWVNTETTSLDSYAQFNSLSAEERTDPGVSAWKTYYLPCHAGTKKEALGFWVCASQEKIGPLTCAEFFSAAL